MFSSKSPFWPDPHLLDTKNYQERLVVEVKPDWGANICANHHIDWHNGSVVMDAQRLLPLVPEADAASR